MTVTAEVVNEVLNSSIGTTTWYKRGFCNTLIYTDGVMAFQQTCDAHWLVDVVVSYMPVIMRDYLQTSNSFYIVSLAVDGNNEGTFTITKEEYNSESNDFINKVVVSQVIPYVDLPEVDIKFYLELANLEPIQFCLLCCSEH